MKSEGRIRHFGFSFHDTAEVLDRILTEQLGVEFVPLNKEEKEIINKVSEIIRNIIAIPCTSCRYCVVECPKKIPIPDIFAIYNERERSRDVYYPKVNYEKLVAEENHGKASGCIKCRKCEHHCPQHIEVTKWLEHIAGEFE